MILHWYERKLDYPVPYVIEIQSLFTYLFIYGLFIDYQ
jgi:hypothetical protein